MMYIEREHIQKWLNDRVVTLVPVDVSKDFDDYLLQLPWQESGSGLDWLRLNGRRAVLSQMTEFEQLTWFQSNPVGADPLVVLWYVGHEPCIAADPAFALANLDEAFWGAPGKRYMFGASLDKASNLVRPIFQHFAEYNGTDTLVAAQL